MQWKGSVLDRKTFGEREQMSLMTDFKDYLIAEHFKVGDRLPGEIELAARFGVGRGQIRAVLGHLAELGMLTRVRNRGTIITAPQVEKLREALAFYFKIVGHDYDDIREARLRLELAMIPLIVRRITPDVCEKIRRNLEMQEKALKTQVPRDVFDSYDLEFHILLLDATRNRSLRIFSHILLLAFERRFRQTVPEYADYARTLKEHRELWRIISSGDVDAAKEAMASHLATGAVAVAE